MELPWPGIDEVGNEMLMQPSNASSVGMVEDSVSPLSDSYFKIGDLIIK